MTASFLPLLAYPLHEIDPGMDRLRDEGEDRLRRVRALLRVSAKTPGLEHWLEVGHRGSLPAMLGPAVKAPLQEQLAERAAVLDSLLSAKSSTKPQVARLQPTVRTLSIAEADKLDEVGAQMCVPIRREERVAMPGAHPLRAPAPVLNFRWEKDAFKKCGDVVTHRPSMTIVHIGKGRVRYDIQSADGVFTENTYACDIPESILAAAFGDAPLAKGSVAAPSEPPLRIPAQEGELPEMLKLQLAGFLQLRMRAHVLTGASGPLNTTRPLWIDNIKLTWKQPGPTSKVKRAVACVKAYLHTASTTCFCGAHCLLPPEQRGGKTEFTGKQYAVVSMEICGEALSNQADMGCPTHGPKCQRNSEFAPGICCCNASVSFSCVHENKGQWKPFGTWLPCGKLNNYDWSELTMLLGTAVEFDRHARPLQQLIKEGKDAKGAKDKMMQLVKTVNSVLNDRVARFDMHALSDSSRPTDADFVKLDMLALQCLREGGMIQGKLTGAQKAPRLVRPGGSELNTEERKLARHFHWIFPRQGQPFGKRSLAQLEAGYLGKRVSEVTDASSVAPSDQTHSPPSEAAPEPSPKRQRAENPDYDYVEIVEYLDPSGLAEMRSQIHALLADPNLPTKQRDRGQYFLQFLNVCDQEYGTELDGPLGLPARPLICKYRSRNDGGRIYPTDMPSAPGWHKGEKRTVCIQAAPREVRPFLCCRWAHDYDMKNAQPEMLRQMATRLSWTDGRIAEAMPELAKWCADRDEYIQHVAAVHDLPTDEQRHHEYRKDMIKTLMIRLMFGGQYESWIKDVCVEFKRSTAEEPRCHRIQLLAAELLQLRTDVFASQQWAGFVEKDRARLRKEGKKKDEDAIDRAVFARIAQKTENDVLTVMRTFLRENGWKTLTLCFDGLCVTHRPERTLDLAALNARILQDTGFKLEIVEKPLFSPTFPKLSLARA
jgi:hypothetical protein